MFLGMQPMIKWIYYVHRTITCPWQLILFNDFWDRGLGHPFEREVKWALTTKAQICRRRVVPSNFSVVPMPLIQPMIFRRCILLPCPLRKTVQPPSLMPVDELRPISLLVTVESVQRRVLQPRRNMVYVWCNIFQSHRCHSRLHIWNISKNCNKWFRKPKLRENQINAYLRLQTNMSRGWRWVLLRTHLQ